VGTGSALLLERIKSIALAMYGDGGGQWHKQMSAGRSTRNDLRLYPTRPFRISSADTSGCGVRLEDVPASPSELPSATLHPLLASRWSPTTFDDSAEASPAEISSVLEAARWAPSAGNAQPWAFLVGRRGDPIHATMVAHLARSSGRWAPGASFLVVNLAHRFVEDTDWEYSEFSTYDLGQAVAHMTIQAQWLGFFSRQFRAFDKEGLTEAFDVPAHWEVTTMTAFGRLVAGAVPPEPVGPLGTRTRRELSEITWAGITQPAG
jgi:hypothetical protein